MVKFIQKWCTHLLFQQAIKKRNRINKKGGKSIVLNLGGKPCVLDRKQFRELRMKHIFKRDAKWEKVKRMQILR